MTVVTVVTVATVVTVVRVVRRFFVVAKYFFLLQKCDKTQKVELGKTLKPQIVTKLKNSNCDQTQKLKL